MDNNGMWTVQEAAAYWRCSPNTARARIRAMPHASIPTTGGRQQLLIDARLVRDWIRQYMVVPQESKAKAPARRVDCKNTPGIDPKTGKIKRRKPA